MFLSTVKKEFEIDPNYPKVYAGKVKKAIAGSLGNSPFKEGDDVHVVVAKRNDDDEFRVYITSSKGTRDKTFDLDEATDFIELKGSVRDKEPHQVIYDNFSSHNSRVF